MKRTERFDDDKEHDLCLINVIELMSSNECYLLELSYTYANYGRYAYFN